MNHIEAMKQALEAIANSGDFLFNWHDCEPNNEREMSRYQEVLAMNEKAFTDLRTAISKCEGWDAYDAGYQAGFEAGIDAPCPDCIEAAEKQSAERVEPVAWMHPKWPNYTGHTSPVTTYMVNGWKPLYTTPPATREIK